MVTTLLLRLDWIWINNVGGLIITPAGIEYIVCGALLTLVMGVISIVLGVTGLVIMWRGRISSNLMPG
jgi:hypothetical protein